jgi:predicted permease
LSANALLLLAGCLTLGFLLARFGSLPQGFTQSLNWWVLNVALPALALATVPRVHLDVQLWFLFVPMWFVFLSSWAVAALLGKMLGWSRARIGAVALIGGLGNTAFAGYPLVEALRGTEALPHAVISDLLGGSIALSIGGIAVAALYSGSKADAGVIVRRIVLFPPFLALLVGFAVIPFGGWPQAVDDVLTRIGSTLAPVALVSVGTQLNFRLGRSQVTAVSAGLAWKLLLAPLLVFLTGTALGIDGQVFAVAVLQAAMSPMVSSAILAQQYKLDAEVASMALGIGVVISLFTVPWANQFLPV